MRTIDDIIQSSLDQMIAEQSSFFEGQVRAYLPAISKRLQEDLDAAGYSIAVKPQKAGDRERVRHHGK